jgi:hypothetical protein
MYFNFFIRIMRLPQVLEIFLRNESIFWVAAESILINKKCMMKWRVD